MRSVQLMVLMFLAGAAGLMSSCAAGGASLYQRLQDEDPKVRLQAVVEAGQRHDHRAVGLLVERLGDGDEDVRLFASLALERVTGQTMGYRFYDLPEARQQAIDRWRQYLLKGAATRPATGATNSASTLPSTA